MVIVFVIKKRFWEYVRARHEGNVRSYLQNFKTILLQLKFSRTVYFLKVLVFFIASNALKMKWNDLENFPGSWSADSGIDHGYFVH